MYRKIFKPRMDFSIIVFLGAEFTYVYSKERGHQVQPSDHAAVVEQVEKEQGVANE